MRTLFIPLFLSVMLPADAARLKVHLIVTPGVVVNEGQCPAMNGANPTAALTGTNDYSFVEYVVKHYPGSVAVAVSGGVPPYRYDWHGLMADASVCSVMPGIVRVTVTDAEGNSVTRRAQVGSTTRTIPPPCGREGEENYTITYRPARQHSMERSYMRPVTENGFFSNDNRDEVQRIPPGPPQTGVLIRSVAAPAERSTK
ncbi:MAG: SprB repeat-containing protein [Flavobacteriales bacterium]|nr:SprB repeat-containing protein [Flavobacteriales bacterium]